MMPLEVIKIAQKKKLKVEFSKYGIASRIGDTIIMNINLPKYDDYCLKVLDHEMRHTGKMTKKDLFMDMFEGSFYKNIKFALKHPGAFTQFIPFGKWRGEWFIDPNQIIIYLILLFIIGVFALIV